MRLAQFINIFLFALVAGVLWGTWFSLSRSIASITPAAFLEIGRTMIRNLARPMRILMPASILSAITLLMGQFAKTDRGKSLGPVVKALRNWGRRFV
jgi:hypothetical protein